jgi:glycosyltransferase involved in cell wall biosynthesis
VTNSAQISRPSAPISSPTISIVVPNYNHGRYLARCLTAFAEQSVLPLEIIVMDDASTDNSVEVAEEFVRRYPFIRLHRNEKNKGVFDNSNLGMQMIRGEYVIVAAADDEVLPGFIEKSAAILRQHPQAAFSCTIGDWVERGTGLNWHVGVAMGKEPCYISPQRMFEMERQGKFFLATNSAIFRTDVIRSMGGYNPLFRWQADWFAFTVAGFRHGLCFVPEPLARLYIDSASYYGAGSRSIEHRRSIQRILDTLLTPEYQDVEPLIRKSGALFLFGAPMLRLLMSDRKYRRFLTPLFLRKNFWHITKVKVKRFTPAFIGNLYFKISGYRARTPKSSPSPGSATAS